MTPSVSAGNSAGTSLTIAPFHELKKRWRVASREFLSLQDFLTTKLIKLKQQPKAHWAIQPPEGKTVFFKAFFVKALPRGLARLNDFRKRVLSKACYQAMEASMPHALHGQPFPPALSRPEGEDDFDDWSTEKPML